MTTITTHVHGDGSLTVRADGAPLELELDLTPLREAPPGAWVVRWHGARLGALIPEQDGLGDVWLGLLVGEVVAQARSEGDAAVALAGAWLRRELEGLARRQSRALSGGG